MALRVINPGLFTTVQDLGRPGYRAFGVSPAGAFDRGSSTLANALLGNDPSAAVLELTMTGGEYRAETPLALALAGAPMPAVVRAADGVERRFEPPVCFPVGAGDRLIISGAAWGARAYLATSGGWLTPVVLGSRSAETPLRAGDVLDCRPGTTPVRRPAVPAPSFDEATPIRVVEGPDFGRLDPAAWNPAAVYRVRAESNRMGLRLDGPPLEAASDPSRLSSPVSPGAVQWAGAHPIILGVACGTMGGYPHVAHVISADLDRLAQLRPGDALRFERVDLAAARALDRAAAESHTSRNLRPSALARGIDWS